MKKFITIRFIFSVVAFPAILFMFSGRANAQQKEKGSVAAVPESINKIFERSCLGCHSSDGNKMAASMLNLSKWENQNPMKAAKKASKICAAVTKGKMPPKKVSTSKPELIPSKTEVEEICKWAESLQVKKEKKK